jgi:hypothetical protein
VSAKGSELERNSVYMFTGINACDNLDVVKRDRGKSDEFVEE